MSQGNVILEFYPVGAAVRVTAIDPVTLVEVTIQGPSTATEPELTRIALAKLRYVIDRKSSRTTKDAASDMPAGRRGDRGVIA